MKAYVPPPADPQPPAGENKDGKSEEPSSVSRWIPMKVGDVVELRSAVNGVNRQVKLVEVIERNDKRVTKFAVKYIDNGESGEVDATKIQRIKQSVG